MRVQLLVTKTDFCIPNLENELRDVGINYEIDYIEENPDQVAAHNIRHSPNIFVNGELVFRHQPTERELKDFFHIH